MTRSVAIIGVALAAVAGCGAALAQASSVNVRTAMVEGVNPAALAIWDVGNGALDEQGLPDASALDADRLAGLKDAAQTLALYSRELAEAGAIEASGPDLVGGAVPEGVASREQIQAAIDADPQGFRALAVAMGAEAEGIVIAVDRGDTDTLASLVANFDGACQSCHERYWYVQP